VRKFHLFSLQGSWYILLAHPEDRALLESNPTAVVGREKSTVHSINAGLRWRF